MIKRIFVDMDGVLADFVKGVTGPKYLNGPLVDENTYDDRKIELSNQGLFLDLPKMPDMDLLMNYVKTTGVYWDCLLYTSPSPRDGLLSRMPSSA